ncbi:hypothetical protein AMCSP20_002406 [Streptococcus pneumoniae 2090008]|nr:hypothetical protein AMCSP20_002406 [Streptococcus pneumoniae 2090008]
MDKAALKRQAQLELARRNFFITANLWQEISTSQKESI